MLLFLVNMFYGRELVGEEFIEAERLYLSDSVLGAAHFSYVCTLIPQVIDVVASDIIPAALPSQVHLAQPSRSRGRTSQASRGHSASRVASLHLVCFLAYAFSYLYINMQQNLLAINYK